MKNLILIGSLMIGLVGCVQAPIELPNNVKTVSMGLSGKQTQIDTVDGSFAVSDEVPFNKISLCAVDVFQNNGVTLSDNANSFFGAYTGNYYQKNNSQQVASGERLKYSDEKTKTLVVHGNVETKPSLVINIIQYDAKIQATPNQVKLTYQNILRAQKNTGVLANDGFSPVGTWAGAKAPTVIDLLNKLSAKYKSCIEP